MDVALGEALRACVGAPHRLGVATDALVACGGDASAFIEARHAQRCGNDSEPVLIDQPMATSGYPIPAPPIAEVTVDPVLVSQLTVAHARSAHWLGALLEEPEPVAPAATGSDCAYELTGRLRQFATALVITGSWSAEAFRSSRI